MRFAPALWPSCTSHHAVLSARHPSIHPPCQDPLPVFSSPSISWPHHHSSSSSASSFMLKHFLLAFCAPYFPFISPTNRLILSPPLLRFSTLVSSVHPSIFSPLFYIVYSPTQPPFFSASLHWQVLWESSWLCQCQAIPSNDNVYYPLCLPLPMD